MQAIDDERSALDKRRSILKSTLKQKGPRSLALLSPSSLASILIAMSACASGDNERPGGPDAGPDVDAPVDAPPVDAPPADGPPPAETPASCQRLAPTCGPNRDESCCTSLTVPGGTFFRSFDEADDLLFPDQGAPATVSELRLDKYEITVGRFRAFLADGQGTQRTPPADNAGSNPRIRNSGWNPAWNTLLVADEATLRVRLRCHGTFQTWTDAAADNESRPLVCLSWYEAMAFCAWDGGYLPTEAEWNFAAAGGSEQRAFAWSSPAKSLEITAAHASYHDGVNCVGDGMPGCAATDLLPVGSLALGTGRWGHADLTGNVWEWTLDWFGEAYPLPCTDCARLTQADASSRVLRGGGFFSGAALQRTGERNSYPPANRLASNGARCARAVVVPPR